MSIATTDNSNPQQGTAFPRTKNKGFSEEEIPERRKSKLLPASNNSVGWKGKLFVGGLPTDITDPEFRDFFSQFGKLEEANVMFNRETRRSRGFGFVTYEDPRVSRCLLQTGDCGDGIGRLVIRGKTCEVKVASPKGFAQVNGRKSYLGNRGNPRYQLHIQGQVMPPNINTDFIHVGHPSDGQSIPFYSETYASVMNGYYFPLYHPFTFSDDQTLSHGFAPLAIDITNGGGPYILQPTNGMPSSDFMSRPSNLSYNCNVLSPFYHEESAYLPMASGEIHSPSQRMETLHQRTGNMKPSVEPIERNESTYQRCDGKKR